MTPKERLLEIIDGYCGNGQLTNEEYEEMLAIVERGAPEPSK